MFKIYYHKNYIAKSQKEVPTMSVNPKYGRVNFNAATLREISDPPEVYFEYDAETKKVRLRSAAMSSEPGKRKTYHQSPASTPHFSMGCKELTGWINEALGCSLAPDIGLLLFHGVKDPESHSVVFDLHQFIRSA